jgi:hypothetical protein
MVRSMPNADQVQFVYRGIVATRSPDGSHLPRWTAEIRRDRNYEFLSAASVSEMQQRIDASLDRRTALGTEPNRRAGRLPADTPELSD